MFLSNKRKPNQKTKMNEVEQFKLYSISKAAKQMSLGKDTLYDLIRSGKIGTVSVGKRKKIPASEIIHYIEENLIRNTLLQKTDIEPIVPQKGESRSKSLFRKIRGGILTNGEYLQTR
jgi:excisionase family DNA binding protein